MPSLVHYRPPRCSVGTKPSSRHRYAHDPTARHRFLGNAAIAAGALLPGIGGSATRFGHTEVLYVTELVGVVLISAGYRIITSGGERKDVKRRSVERRGIAPAREG